MPRAEQFIDSYIYFAPSGRDAGLPPQKDTTHLQTSETLQGSGHEDLAEALEIANTLPEVYQDNAHLAVDRAFVQAGMDPLHSSDYYLTRAIRRQGDRMHYEKIALFQTELGQIRDALQTVEQRTYPTIGLYMQLAEATFARRDGELHPFFDRAFALARKRSEPHGPWDYRDIAKTQFAIGIPPHDTLRMAEKNVRTGSSVEEGNRYILATMHAEVGDPQKALAYIRSLDRNRSSLSLGLAPAAIADLYASIALSRPAGGAGIPREIIAEGIKETMLLTPHAYARTPYDRDISGLYYDQARMFGRLAQAQAGAGINPRPLFSFAMATATLEKSNLGTDAFRAVGEAQVASALDGRKAFASALRIADTLGTDPTGEALQAIAWEDIAKAQMTAGYMDRARTTIERFKGDEDMQLNKVELLAQLGSTKLQMLR